MLRCIVSLFFSIGYSAIADRESSFIFRHVRAATHETRLKYYLKARQQLCLYPCSLQRAAMDRDAFDSRQKKQSHRMSCEDHSLASWIADNPGGTFTFFY